MDMEDEATLPLEFTLEIDCETDDSGPYVIPFEENGTSVEDHLFLPHITSSPNNLREQTVNSEESTLSYAIKNNDSSIICRPGAGRNPGRRLEESTQRSHVHVNLSEMIDEIGLPSGWTSDPLWFLKFIDDGLAGEKLPISAASTHITQHKEIKMIHAAGSELFFKKTLQNAQRIGMQINSSKTKILCINVAKNSHLNSYINLNDFDQARGDDEMKMLGFMFGRRPNAEANTAYIRKKLYGKQWIIRHLKKAGISQSKLVEVYKCYIRPVIEYLSNVYHALLSEELSKDIKNMQRSALRLIFGNSILYKKCLEKADLPTLSDRRAIAFRSFAVNGQELRKTLLRFEHDDYVSKRLHLVFSCLTCIFVYLRYIYIRKA